MTKQVITGALCSIVLCACGGEAGDTTDIGETPGAEVGEAEPTGRGEVDQESLSRGAVVEDAPEEILNATGQLYRRADLYTEAEREEIKSLGTPRGDSPTLEELAAQLRGHMLAGGVYYIQAEPAYETAARILSQTRTEPTDEAAPYEVRKVWGSEAGDSADSRNHTTISNTSSPNTYIGFYATSGTSNMIGARTAVTAAHVVYSTLEPTFTEGWYCADGTVSNTGCPGIGYPGWRFGVEDGNGFSNWIFWPCIKATITTAFTGMSDASDAHDFAQEDLAILDLSDCTAPNTGNYGTEILDDTELLSVTGQVWGYPARAKCQSGDSGTFGDCNQNTKYRYNGDTSKPFSGAEIWGSTSTDVQKGSRAGDFTIDSSIDTTQGMSGSAIYYKAPARRLLGVLSGSGTNTNIFHRWTSWSHNLAADNSDFPDD